MKIGNIYKKYTALNRLTAAEHMNINRIKCYIFTSQHLCIYYNIFEKLFVDERDNANDMPKTIIKKNCIESSVGYHVFN